MAEEALKGRVRSKLWRSLQLLSQDEGIYRLNLLELLDGALSDLKPLWAINPDRGLEAARFTIAASIRAHLAQVEPRRSNLPLTSEQRAEQYKAVVLVYFNILPGQSSLDLRKKDLTQRRDWLAMPGRGALKTSVRTSQRDFDHAITEIEHILNGSRYKPVVATDSSSEADPADTFASLEPGLIDSVRPDPGRALNPLYSPRPKLHKAFDDYMQSGAKVIVFVGQAGMGKTWAARELAQRLSGSPVPMIRFDKGEPNRYDLPGALLVAGTGVSTNDTASRLAALCCGENAAPVVILDNFDSADQLIPILPQSRSSTIVATCRTKGAIQPAEFRFVAVDRMTLPEAAKLVALNNSPLTSSDAKKLAKFLHGYPLVIEKACVQLRKTGISVGQFCAELEAEAVGRMRTSDQDNLDEVLRRVVASLEQEDQVAYRLLWLMTYIYSYGNSSSNAASTLWYFFRTELGPAPRDSLDSPHGIPVSGITNLSFESALASLTDYSFVHVRQGHDEGLDERLPHNKGWPLFRRWVDVHPLTLTLLSRLFAGKERQFLASLWSTVSWPYDNLGYIRGSDEGSGLIAGLYLVKAIYDMMIDRRPWLLEFADASGDRRPGFERVLLTIYDAIAKTWSISIDEPMTEWIERNRERILAEPSVADHFDHQKIENLVERFNEVRRNNEASRAQGTNSIHGTVLIARNLRRIGGAG